MKKKLVMAGMGLVIAAGIVAACSKSNEFSNNGITADAIIYMKGSAYSPADITLVPGSKIVWMNDDNMIHTVTANDSSFSSADINPGATYTRTFDSLGIYNYHCMHHPGMTGVVKIVTR